MAGSTQSDSDRYELIGLAGIPSQGDEQALCQHCGSAAPRHLVRVIGAWSVVDGIARWDCQSCARAHLEEIESRVGAPEASALPGR